MTCWKLKCESCGNVWTLEVSFDLYSMGKLYHYCPYCKRNRVHQVIERVD